MAHVQSQSQDLPSDSLDGKCKKILCYNKGCGKIFSVDENTEGTRLRFTVRQTRLDRGNYRPNYRTGNQIFCTQIFTRSGVFFTAKLAECQCKKYTKISEFSHITFTLNERASMLKNVKYFHIKNLK